MHVFFFFNDTAPTEIYTLSLHDALPISARSHRGGHAALSEIPFLWRIRIRLGMGGRLPPARPALLPKAAERGDRKSTRLNSSHRCISYAVFCLKKKKRNTSTKTSNTITY